ncbi:streptogramin lyase [Sphingomonas aerophila]|jgi:virginiamycin B lyase|uniref:Streptogramin lyase n=2 Tax=Sphingomonas aerophila TaxID=1344948 RepID=A0A7W9EUN4_9SPHN|nr:streptogramin lyase [Sphingomonas aerophila]
MTERARGWAAAALGCCIALTPAMAAAPAEQVQTVPGFADFLAVDGDSVWATNVGRVERWSRSGKRAEVAMTRPCGAMAVAFRSLWVADCKQRTLNRIDLKTAKIIAAIPTGIANPAGELNVVAGAGSVWVASDATGMLARIDPARNQVATSIRVDPGTCFLSFGLGSLWAVSATRQTLQKVDPGTNSVVQTTALGREPGFLVAGEGAVWVQEQGDGTVARVDPVTGAVSGRVKVDETLKYGDIDAGGGKIWLRTTAGQSFVVIDPKSLAIRARVGKASGSGALRYTRAGVWTTAHDAHTLSWWKKPGRIGS